MAREQLHINSKFLYLDRQFRQVPQPLKGIVMTAVKNTGWPPDLHREYILARFYRASKDNHLEYGALPGNRFQLPGPLISRIKN